MIERTIGRNPSAPDPLVVSKVAFDGDAERDVAIAPPSSSIPPALPLTAPDPITGDAVIAPGQTVTITLTALAQSEGKVDIQAVVAAQEREEDGVTPKRAAGGSDVLRGFTIGQDEIVGVLADDDGDHIVTPGNTAYDDSGLVRPGMIRAG